ncbi:hypothetical protein [Lysobacter gummosus]|uniref:hypothetical protein n=1 Tax=Lysobacter gummosus TaxID=262324 RepID=UPI00363FA38F
MIPVPGTSPGIARRAHRTNRSNETQGQCRLRSPAPPSTGPTRTRAPDPSAAAPEPGPYPVPATASTRSIRNPPDSGRNERRS